MSGGGGGSDSQTTTSVPWGPAQPFLRESMQEARNLYRGGDLAPVAPESPWAQQARDLAAQTALGGGFGTTTGGIGLANQTLGGDFLDLSQNPYFQDAISYAQQPVIDAWQSQIAPGIDASFGSTAGGLGSGAYAATRNRAEDTLARNLAGAATQAGASMYGDERARQMQAMAASPALEQAGYGTFDRLAQAGMGETARQQFELEAPMRGLQQYTGLINANPAFGFGTQTGESDYKPGALDLVSSGAGLGMLAWGLCDERTKRDAEHLATTEKGVKLYRYRYRSDVAEFGDDAPWHIGPMAQELEDIVPEAVYTDSIGLKRVRLEAI